MHVFLKACVRVCMLSHPFLPNAKPGYKVCINSNHFFWLSLLVHQGEWDGEGAWYLHPKMCTQKQETRLHDLQN